MNKHIKQALFISFYLSVFLPYGFNISSTCFAQDVRASQFQSSPLILNPALTGVFSGDMRILAKYRNQWSDITAPYTFYYFSYDAGILKKSWKKGFLGTGIDIHKEESGDLNINTMQVDFFLSGNKIVNENNSLSAGIQAGFAESTIRYNKLLWEDQYNRTGLDPAFYSGENLSSYQFFYGDFALGLNWNYGRGGKYSFDNQLKSNVGVALFHINRPKQYFLGVDRLYPKFLLYGDMVISFSKRMAVLPSLLFLNQHSVSEISLGALLRYVLKEESKYTNNRKGAAIAFGGYYRSGSAIIIASQFEISAYALGISYDIITSGLKLDTERGGFELSLRCVNPVALNYRKPSTNPRY